MSVRVLLLLAILATPLWAQKEVATDPGAFRPDPTYADQPYDPEKQVAIYGGKHPNATARPLIELGRPLYAYGPFQPAPTPLGEKNPLFWHFMVYGDWRTAVAYTRRYGGWLSNSVRVIGCFGQDLSDGERTANGAIVLLENSLITSEPLAFVPYLNLFAGFDRPQSLARVAAAGGVLKNTGMLFETDALTGFPKLDDTGNDTVGGALGVEYLFGLDHQIVVEAGGFHAFGEDEGRPAKGDQFGFEARYQLPLLNRWILRADAMIGFREDEEDLSGIRLEFRLKF